MNFEARIESLDGKLPKVSYHWDPETDILSVACKGGATSDGLNGTVDLEGADGSFVVIDVAGGSLRGVDVVSWPDDVRTVADLATPAVAKDGRVVFPSRLSQPGVAAIPKATNVVHMHDNRGAADLSLDAGVVAELNHFFPPPKAATALDIR